MVDRWGPQGHLTPVALVGHRRSPSSGGPAQDPRSQGYASMLPCPCQRWVKVERTGVIQQGSRNEQRRGRRADCWGLPRGRGMERRRQEHGGWGSFPQPRQSQTSPGLAHEFAHSANHHLCASHTSKDPPAPGPLHVPGGPCLECSFSAPPPPSVSVRLAPWLCHPTPSPSECSPARFLRGRDCHSEHSGPRFVLHYHLPPPREGEDLASPVHRWVPRAGGQPGLHMARFPPQVCPPHGSRDLGGLLGPKPRKGKRLYSGRAGPMLHFLCEVTVSPAPGTAITSLDCSRVPLPTVQKAPSC